MFTLNKEQPPFTKCLQMLTPKYAKPVTGWYLVGKKWYHSQAGIAIHTDTLNSILLIQDRNISEKKVSESHLNTL